MAGIIRCSNSPNNQLAAIQPKWDFFDLFLFSEGSLLMARTSRCRTGPNSLLVIKWPKSAFFTKTELQIIFRLTLAQKIEKKEKIAMSSVWPKG